MAHHGILEEQEVEKETGHILASDGGRLHGKACDARDASDFTLIDRGNKEV